MMLKMIILLYTLKATKWKPIPLKQVTALQKLH